MASGHVNRIQKAEHMAAPTNAAYVKKALANSEPSTHGTEPISRRVRHSVRFRGISRHHADAAKLTPLIHSGLTEIGSPGTSVLCKAERHVRSSSPRSCRCVL